MFIIRCAARLETKRDHILQNVDLAIWPGNGENGRRTNKRFNNPYCHPKTPTRATGEIMTKKNIERQIAEAKEQGVKFPPHIGYILKGAGEVLIDDFQDTNGQFMDKEARKARGGEPLASVGEGDIRIECMGGSITITREKENRPMWSVPVGQSDKVTTASIPWQKITGYLYQTIISCVSEEYAEQVITPLINEWLDMGVEETEDGRLKIDQNKLPEVSNPIEVAMFLESLKRQFTSKSRGTSTLNIALDLGVVQPVAPSPSDMREAEMARLRLEATRGIISHSTTNEVTTGDASQDSSESVSPGPTASVDPEVVASSQATSTLFQEREQLTQIITQVLGDEKRTIGYLKKAIDLDENTWRARLDAMIKTGEVEKEGRARSCRYFLPGVAE